MRHSPLTSQDVQQSSIDVEASLDLSVAAPTTPGALCATTSEAATHDAAHRTHRPGRHDEETHRNERIKTKSGGKQAVVNVQDHSVHSISFVVNEEETVIESPGLVRVSPSESLLACEW